jgi:beta-lactamase regulating signal transducer with metallopeptidase domain
MNQKNPAFPALLALFLGWSLLWAAIATAVVIWRSILFAANRLSPKSPKALGLIPPVVSAAALAEAFEPMSIDENEIELESPKVTASIRVNGIPADLAAPRGKKQSPRPKSRLTDLIERETVIKKGDFKWP